MAMMDRMGDSTKPPEPWPAVDKATADIRSLKRVYAGSAGDSARPGVRGYVFSKRFERQTTVLRRGGGE